MTIIGAKGKLSLLQHVHAYVVSPGPSGLKIRGCQQLKLLFLQHLAIPEFTQSDHTVSKLSADAVKLLLSTYDFPPEVFGMINSF